MTGSDWSICAAILPVNCEWKHTYVDWKEMLQNRVEMLGFIQAYRAADLNKSIYLGRRMLAVTRVNTQYQQALLGLIYQSQEDEIVLRHKRQLLQMSSINTKGDGNSTSGCRKSWPELGHIWLRLLQTDMALFLKLFHEMLVKYIIIDLI